MLRAWRVADVRAAEAVRLDQVPDGALMQRAAAGLAAVCAGVLRDAAGGVSGRRVALLVGAGNNGGDALWAGERLARRGARVDAVLCAEAVHAEGLAALRAAGGTAVDARDPATRAAAVRLLDRAHLVVDGLVGLGGSPGLREPAAGLVAGLRPVADGGPAVVAVDLPSGVDPDGGGTPAPHVRADVTVTFGAAKPCLLLPPASRAAGRVVEVDIGLGPLLPPSAAVERLHGADAAALWPVPGAGTDKYRRGVVGVVAGSAAYTGAAVLAVAGALRAGAGMVRYVGPEHAAEHVRLHHPEAVVGEGRVQAWVLGPGVDADAGDGQRAAAELALGSGEPCVVDAGALALVPAMPGALGPHVLLTPHAGELARLLGALGEPVPSREDVEQRAAAHVVRAAALTGATVLLKGSTTLVATPEGRLRSQADAPGWLATAGAGDVLAGIAGTLLAAGLDAFDAGPVAALVHGRAAARAGGGGPVTAGAVAEAVPATVAALLDR
ncbi:bifunctional ADP-dependent NAD(P)H-hydrate dehydratase/NAD(P)H-hydrate epimerase [Kineosporia sp. R_H_3]|uniref:bifunctional ADP-dependent NAD(P)H-hydrate dehydratase/NAD(P)H-hydrate epimerase n=1 Tax=Kineosporia sp. R_H_3 TaxID=1961848 RepID=UPI000B4BF80C|nr:bifunctional ADP-dependent NAD(P)H-hydrate dehydratase/NAD(P)H-hydrate epimerase [Kineosporia sp. R_H_3]